MLVAKIFPPNKSYLKKHLQPQYQRGSLILLLVNSLCPKVLHHSWEEWRHHCLSRLSCNLIDPKQLSLFLEGLVLPFPSEGILSGYEDIVSSGSDQFTTRVKTDPDATLVRHTVDVQKAVAEFREVSERRHDTSSQAYRLHKNLPNVRLCKSVSASATRIQDIDVGRRMPLRSKSQASGMSSRYKKHASTSIMTFLRIGSP